MGKMREGDGERGQECKKKNRRRREPDLLECDCKSIL